MRLPTYYLSHGGGPWPWIDGPMRTAHDGLERSLATLFDRLGATPSAVLMISGHWEAPAFSVQTSPAPSMVYDYGGFPEHTYSVRYDAPGSPDLAQRVIDLGAAAGIEVLGNPTRGYDHGAFVPMHVIAPAAQVPVVQLSLCAGYDPVAHLALGAALAPLRDEGVLLLGSGSSFHNLRLFGDAGRAPSVAFDAWLQRTVLGAVGAERSALLEAWESAPSARAAHPWEEHLMPLHVVIGAAVDESAALDWHDDAFFGGITMSSFRIGDLPDAA